MKNTQSKHCVSDDLSGDMLAPSWPNLVFTWYLDGLLGASKKFVWAVAQKLGRVGS